MASPPSTPLPHGTPLPHSTPSPPSTPSPDPSCRDNWRFKSIRDDCEWVEMYRPEGHHPVNLGDTFHDGCYKVIRKLGEGSFSTVWLVVSRSGPKYAAMKVISAKASAMSTEITILKQLSASEDPNAQHITKLLDSFMHEGPNGVHLCVVFELMAASVASLVDDLPGYEPEPWASARYPMFIAKKILLHTLRGLSLVHKNGLVHSDVQPGNLLFAIEDLDEVEEQQLKQNEAETTVSVERIDGKADKWAPANLYLRQTLHEHVKLGADLCIKLSDFGVAFFASDPPASATTPIGLRAPELILKRSFDNKIDIWSFGCLIYEVLTSEPLFALMTLGPDKDIADDDHFVQLNETIKQLPESIMQDWKGASKWYGPDFERLCPYTKCEPYPTLEQRFAEQKHPDIGDEEAATICQIIRETLAYDPAERPSVDDLLGHAWFSE